MKRAKRNFEGEEPLQKKQKIQDIEQIKTFKSRNVNNPSNSYYFPEASLNLLHPPGFPPHSLTLKHGEIVTSLLNIDENILINTKLQIIQFTTQVLITRILNGPQRGKKYYLPRCTFYLEHPINFKRIQFPVKKL